MKKNETQQKKQKQNTSMEIMNPFCTSCNNVAPVTNLRVSEHLGFYY